MSLTKQHLLRLYRQYTRQINADIDRRYKIAKQLQAYAPYKSGDKVMWLPEHKYTGHKKFDKYDRYGIVVSCEYTDKLRGGGQYWQICVLEATKTFAQNRARPGYIFLLPRHVRKFKE